MEKTVPYINVKSAGKLSKEQKKKIAEAITQTMKEVAGKPAHYTYVVFEDIPAESWAIGGELLSGD